MTDFGRHYTQTGLTLADLKARNGESYNPPRRYRDQTANPGTIGIWDFPSEFGAPGGYNPVLALTDRTEMANLIEGGAPAKKDDLYGVVSYKVGGGIRMDGTGLAPGIKLADVTWKAGLMLTAWFRSSGMTDVGYNARFMKLGPVYTVPTAASGGGAAINFEVIQPGVYDVPIDAYTQFGASLRAAFSDGKLHQIAIQSQDVGGGNHQLVVFLDRIRVFTDAPITANAGTTTEVAIGARDGSGSIVGTWYRARLDDTTLSGLTGREIVGIDWRKNYTRLSNAII